MRRPVVRLFGVACLLLLAALAAAGVWAWSQARASLAQLDGSSRLPGLSAVVTVERDALGVPAIRGATRTDVAAALGFVHAQERFFQMDLARRRAAGELAALVGPAALDIDRAARIHRFRAIAARAVSLMDPADRAALDAYTAGVGAGLRALRASPPEYVVLRQAPEPWRPEDSVLVVLSMFVTLQETDGWYESTLATMHDVLPREMFEFMAPRRTDWDSPLTDEPAAAVTVPGPEVYDLRARRTGIAAGSVDLTVRWRAEPGVGSAACEWARAPFDALPLGGAMRCGLDWAGTSDAGTGALGSNNWAVAGHLTADGRPLVASDMHLVVRVPNTWYRAMMEWPDATDGSRMHRLVGVTLPGLPALIAGSNTHVAWGFTNTYADWSDVVLLEMDPADATRYRTPAGWRHLDRFDEVIEVAGEPDARLAVSWTIWGPLLEPDRRGRPRAYRWVAHDADRLHAAMTTLEEATNLDDALAALNRLGAPGQNVVVADRAGRIGWSVWGALPRRVGHDGRLPSSWADGTRGWSGWLEPQEYPRIVDPESGRIWTANARVVGGEMLAALGDGNYEVGSRARIARDRLMARDRFTARDMLAIQLDTQADFLARWRDALLETLAPDAVAGDSRRARLREVVAAAWSGHASADSAAYRFTRMFREEVSARVAAFVLAECYEADPSFDYGRIRRSESPIWALVHAKPMHLLDPRYADWHAFLLDAVDAVIAQATGGQDVELSGLAWSDYNVTAYRHPLSASVPFSSAWLDMPPQALPGDRYTLRVHWGALAASVRMVVSPGQEADGIMHMPTGQSGHFLSPFYRNSHPAWVNGDPTPLLPGPRAHVLVLAPG